MHETHFSFPRLLVVLARKVKFTFFIESIFFLRLGTFAIFSVAVVDKIQFRFRVDVFLMELHQTFLLRLS